METNIDIFDFVEYRGYLKAIYLQRKQQGKYTYDRYAQDLGLSERTFLQHVLSGKRDLNDRCIPGIIQGLGLQDLAKEHFLNLVRFSLSRDANDKQVLWQKIRQRTREARNEIPMSCQRLDLLEHWYSFVIKELLCMGITDHLQIRKALCEAISLDTIRKTVSELIRLEFVAVDNNEYFRDLEPEISAPTQAEFSTMVQHYQSELLSLAARNMNKADPEFRENQTLTMPLSPEAFFRARQIIRQCRDQLIQIYKDDIHIKNGVYHLNLSLYPLAMVPDELNNRNEE